MWGGHRVVKIWLLEGKHSQDAVALPDASEPAVLALLRRAVAWPNGTRSVEPGLDTQVVDSDLVSLGAETVPVGDVEGRRVEELWIQGGVGRQLV